MWNSRTMAAFQTKKQESEGRSAVAQAVAELRHSGYTELRRIVCDFCDGTLMLTGHVPSYYHKQLAQTLVLRRLPHLEIRNELEVFSCRIGLDSVARAEEPAFA